LETGWKRSPESYWNYYSENGGFPKISKSFGTCVGDMDNKPMDVVEQFAEAVNEVRRKQCDAANPPQTAP